METFFSFVILFSLKASYLMSVAETLMNPACNSNTAAHFPLQKKAKYEVNTLPQSIKTTCFLGL